MATLSSDHDRGAALHRRVVAEGGWMVHSGERSWFERKADDGSITRKFSPGLMADIVRNRAALSAYAAARRRSLSAVAVRTPRGVGTSVSCAPSYWKREGERKPECNA